MDQENNKKSDKKVKAFFSKKDIEFLKEINENTKNLGEALNTSSSSSDEQRENVTKIKG